MFKTIDDKIAELGFVKVKENQNIVVYERYDERFHYIQVVDIMHKQSGNHIISSYDKNLIDVKGIGNTAVGLTLEELNLFTKKFNKLKKKWK